MEQYVFIVYCVVYWCGTWPLSGKEGYSVRVVGEHLEATEPEKEETGQNYVTHSRESH
jgi:hypothetical protein